MELDPAKQAMGANILKHHAWLQRKHEEAQTFLEVVNQSKLGVDWRQNAAMHEPGQLAARNIAEGIHIDPGLLASTQRFSGLSPQWISACSATLDVPHSRFAFLGGTNSVLKVMALGLTSTSMLVLLLLCVHMLESLHTYVSGCQQGFCSVCLALMSQYFEGALLSWVQAAKAAGMLSVAVPAALSGRGQYVADFQVLLLQIS